MNLTQDSDIVELDLKILHGDDNPDVLFPRLKLRQGFGSGKAISPTKATSESSPSSSSVHSGYYSPMMAPQPPPINFEHLRKYIGLTPESRQVPVHAERAPPLAAEPASRFLHQFFQTTIGTVSGPDFAQVITYLQVSDPSKPHQRDMLFPVELDLGSSAMWVLGQPVKAAGHHGGIGPYISVYWPTYDHTGLKEYTASYIDKTIAKFTLRPANLKLKLSNSAPQPDGESCNQSLPIKIGVVHSVTNHDNLPVSGIIGLAPRMGGGTEEYMPSFLWQTSWHYASPEMTLVLGLTEGRLTIGGRPPDLPDDAKGKYKWRFAGEISSNQSDWMVDCPCLMINDTKYPISTGRVLFDTGAASIYLDEAIVIAYYSHFEDVKFDKDKRYRLIPVDGTPKRRLKVKFQFKENTTLWVPVHVDPTSKIHIFDGKEYQRGAIQSKSIDSVEDDSWDPPCVIGRMAMYSADLNLHFAPGKSPKIFFREKEFWRAEDHISERPYDWGKIDDAGAIAT
ncbi:hypothetical protein MIND_00587300 [Mycena indigotica]|uniref:Uncharacterized protein n=1 Tax=Mycena indigotica TaxID=2126181 RepID=A0A8H6STB8_9AGAR|nr:uncharacterized protein MIND_00587300 [Mycena indigotica]KAF7303580.1 hypothetical protein MIND_00587300 [Mycena indigotica]